MFELLTGRLPFEGPVPAIVAQCLRDVPTRPSVLRKGLSSEIDDLCLTMLEKEPVKRISSMADVVAAIDKVRGKPRVRQVPRTNVRSRRPRR